MILCDAGPLIAIVDPRDPNHAHCASTLRSTRGPLVTSWPCITEAMHFLGDAGGWGYQRALWHMSGAQILTIRDLSADDVRRMPELMDRYQNVPMDLADASLVAFAEAMKLHRVFTLDSDFRIYRTAAGAAFEIVP